MTTNPGRLAGRHIFITGASSGFGTHFARVVAQEGAVVTIAARRTDRLEDLAQEIRHAGGQANPVELDVTSEASTIAAYDAAEAALGPVHGVVANAGVTIDGSSLDIAIEDFEWMYAVNVKGSFLTAREGAKRMRAAGDAAQGRIVLISSITGKLSTPGIMPYSSSKAAVSHMGKIMAREWIRSGPNVNMLSPGYVDTELAGGWFHTEGGQKQIASWPRRSLMDASALDDTLVFLLSDASRQVTGSEFTIDDGQSL